jgi:hypothetical protein
VQTAGHTVVHEIVQLFILFLKDIGGFDDIPVLSLAEVSRLGSMHRNPGTQMTIFPSCFPSFDCPGTESVYLAILHTIADPRLMSHQVLDSTSSLEDSVRSKYCLVTCFASFITLQDAARFIYRVSNLSQVILF